MQIRLIDSRLRDSDGERAPAAHDSRGDVSTTAVERAARELGARVEHTTELRADPGRPETYGGDPTDLIRDVVTLVGTGLGAGTLGALLKQWLKNRAGRRLVIEREDGKTKVFVEGDWSAERIDSALRVLEPQDTSARDADD